MQIQRFAFPILADVKSRLAYRAQAYVRDEVALYQPSAEDLDYPARLERARDDGAEGGSEAEGTSEFRSWYPPLQQTLLLLAQLYRCVDSLTFGGLAQEALKVCVDQIMSASAQIVKKTGSTMDGHLFLIKHLLALREQIAQFDADFGTIEKELDFTHMRDHVKRIMGGQASLFALGSSNAVLQLLGRGRPRVNPRHVDSKKELEKQLKAACEAFIMTVTKATVEPMLGFITKVTALQVTGSQQALREHAFASVPKISGVVKSVHEHLDAVLPSASGKLKLYLSNPRTRAILLKPIKSNITEAHAQIAALLEREYTEEDRQSVSLKPTEELQALLDMLD